MPSGASSGRGGPAQWQQMTVHANYHAHQPATGIRGGGDASVARTLASFCQAPRGNAAASTNSPRATGGSLTFCKTQAQGSMASYGTMVMGGGSPVQDVPEGRDAQRATHHIEARMFGKAPRIASAP